MKRIAISLQRNQAPDTHEETCPAARLPYLRGFASSLGFSNRAGANNAFAVPRMQRSIPPLPRQPAPGLDSPHSHRQFPDETWCYSMIASRTSSIMNLKKRQEALQKAQDRRLGKEF
jgi:hypothetical protein